MGFSSATVTDSATDDRSDDTSAIDDGSLKYTAEGGANSSRPTYQEASGAPIEVTSPLGYSVGFVTVVFLNTGKMIGSGVFSTRTSAYLDSKDARLTPTDEPSIDDRQRRRLGRPQPRVLGDRVPDGREHAVRVSRVRVVLPQPLRVGGRLPGAVVSAAAVFLSHRLRRADGRVLV